MIVELLAIMALLTGGVPIAATLGIRGPLLPGVGFVLGSALSVSVGGILVFLGFGGPPILVLSVTAGAGLTVAVADRESLRGAFHRPQVAMAFGAALVGVGVLWRWGAVNLSPDSFRYVTTGALLADGKLEQATGSLLLTRGLAAPILHAPANLQGEFHLVALTPLFAVATVMALMWAIRVGLQDLGVDRRTTLFVQLVAAALLLSFNRFVFHAFYVNSHLFIAGWVLVLAASIWIGNGRGSLPHIGTVVRGLLIVAIVLARPDGALLAGLVLVPLLADRSVPRAERFLPLVVLGAATLGWNQTIARFSADGGGVPAEVQILIALGVALIVVAVMLIVWPHLLPKRFASIAEVALWALVMVASVRRPDILLDSARATYRNTLLGDGGWGVSLGVLGVLVLLVLAFAVDSTRSALRFPVTAFVPFSLLLAFLREGAYRVGAGDSLNRMLIHIVPLAVLFLAAAVAARRWRMPAALSRGSAATPSPWEADRGIA